MTEVLAVMVAALVVVAASAVVGQRLGIAPPLVLVAIGVGASFLPVFGSTAIDPEWILQGILPPLLYSSAVSMPAMNFRREFGAISGLSVVLVLGSALLLGLFFSILIPDLGFAYGVALGAIVSPTDAVATSIIKGASASKRVVAMLDGESLLNDATALVLLRTATVAATMSFSVWGTVGTFAYSVALAVVVGGLVGWANLVVRKRITDSTVNTVISFTVPFLASVPASLLGASGLVAAVVAGLITGFRAPRDLSPTNRLSDSQNWRTVELVLEGAVFLTMGVQLKSIVTDVQHDHAGVASAVVVAAGALVLLVLVRAAYVGPLLLWLGARIRRGEEMRVRVQEMRDSMADPDAGAETYAEVSHRRRPASQRQLDRLTTRLTRLLANIDYFLRQPLGWREGTVVVWAGMRGAVTVAAAQTLDDDTPQRSVLVLVAFAVATLSLLVQGGTVGPLVRRLGADAGTDDTTEQDKEQLDRLMKLMRSSADTIPVQPHEQREPTPESFAVARDHRIAVLQAQRSALLDARDDGTFDADMLEDALAELDASQIAIDMRGRRLG